MAILSKGKEKSPKPMEVVPYSPQYKHMSKEQFVAAENKRREVEAKAKVYREKLLAGEDIKPEGESEIKILEDQLKNLATEAATAEAMSSSVEGEKKAKELKKKVTVLRLKIGKAKKALKK